MLFSNERFTGMLTVVYLKGLMSKEILALTWGRMGTTVTFL